MTPSATIAAALAAAAVLLPAAAAQAASPPKGVYDCRYRVDDGPAGNIRIVDKTTYRYSGRKPGTFTTSARTIRFTSGVLRGVYDHARWRKGSGTTLISLYDGDTPGETATDVLCARRTS
jgi:hypothetical protein